MSCSRSSVRLDTYTCLNERNIQRVPIVVRGKEIVVELYPWAKAESGKLYRRGWCWVTVTSKTRKFETGLFAQAVIGMQELAMYRGKKLNTVKKWKTECMFMTLESMIENAYEDRISFPGKRGRFSVVSIEASK